MQDKKNYKIYIFSIIFVIVLIPIFLDTLIFDNNIHSSLDNGQWSSFFGSYIGGVIGGLGTLIAVYITTIETRKIQQHTQEEIDEEKAMSAKKERKIFSDEIAKVISKYLSDLKICYQANQIIYKKFARIRYLENGIKFSELSSYRIVCQTEIDSLYIDVKHIQENQPVPAEHLNLLRIYLNNIDQAQELLEKFKNANTLSGIENTKESDFFYGIDDLIKLTADFCYKYVNITTD